MIRLTLLTIRTFALSLLLCGCELGVDQSTLVNPNYDLLTNCARPEQAAITGIVLESLCGVVSVYENRESQAGRKIDLNIMLIPATTAVVKPDPIFFLAGGPGQSAGQTGPYLFSRLGRLRRERDIVLVDQRGTGESNSLACLPETDFGLLDDISIEEMEAAQTLMLKKCLVEFDAEPSLYTTPIAMDDLDEVRRVLGYRQINLFGMSYGTRAALVYLRRHGDTVRSAVLDGVAPLSMSVPANIAVDAQSAFDILLKDCIKQTGCAEAFPNLLEHFHALVQHLAVSPRTATISHPRTGEQITGPVHAVIVNRLIRAVMYDRTLSSLVPLAIEEAYQGNFQPLTTLAYSFSGENTQMSNGMMASVLCAEDMRRVSQPNDTDDFENVIFSSLSSICEYWPKGNIPDNYFDPVTSDVPILLLSGKFDPVTPPKYAWNAAETLSNHEHIVVPGVGHGTSLQGCVPDILEAFFESANPKGLNIGCVSDLSRPPFFTSFAGATAYKSATAYKKETDQEEKAEIEKRSD